MSDSASGVTIELENVSKRYSGTGKPAVDNVSMTIPAGEIVVFVGPSGCGKTTTMKLINRLIKPTSGRILVGGEDVRDRHPDELRRHIGYVIQSGGLFPHMTIADNVALVPRMLGWDKARVSARIDEMLELVGLEPDVYRARYPRQLSGGQQQRVGVARALAADPPVLLMDEPFGAVDPITRNRLQDELLSLQEELHKTIVFVTHDFDEAAKLGDRIAVLAEGSRIVQYAPPADIIANPADAFVEGFIGGGGAMKLLKLTRIADVELEKPVTVRTDDDLATVGKRLADANETWGMVIDSHHRPVGWVDREELESANGASLNRLSKPFPQVMSGRLTLDQALEALLSAESVCVPVTRRREYVGTVTLNCVQVAIAKLREDAHERKAAHEREDADEPKAALV